MLARRMELRHETMMLGGKAVTLEYSVSICEPLPEPCANVFGPTSRDECIDARDMEPVGPVRALPVRFHCPSKAEYCRSYQRAGRLPACVRRTRARVFASIHNIERRVGFDRPGYPRRLSEALAAYSFEDLASAYDPGLLARIRWFARDHAQRKIRFQLRQIMAAGREATALELVR